MKAMILAAGLGTRLKPLTNNIPKALVKVKNKTLLELIIEKLKKSGIAEIIINVHHFPDMIIDYLETNKYFNTHIEISDERDMLLDTGGGIKKARWFLESDDFIVHNVDVISDLNLQEMYVTHKNNNPLATVAVKSRKTQRYFLFDNELNLCGWKNNTTGDLKIVRSSDKELIPLAYSGIQIISPQIFDLMTGTGKFSIIDTYLRLAKNEKIKGYCDDKSSWYDVGKLDVLNFLQK
ncbi:MAG: nucleotidyltransferase family protein [Ignavibacteriales bacterium]|nr:nucleotidyltransferase family protein [Ignavibacteriales bacterium]